MTTTERLAKSSGDFNSLAARMEQAHNDAQASALQSAAAAGQASALLQTLLQGTSVNLVLPGAVMLSHYVTATGIGVDNAPALQAALNDAAGRVLKMDVPGVIGVSKPLWVKSGTVIEWTSRACVVTARADFLSTGVNNMLGTLSAGKAYPAIFTNWNSYLHWFLTGSWRTALFNLSAYTGFVGTVPYGNYDWHMGGQPVDGGGNAISLGALYRNEGIRFVEPQIDGNMETMLAVSTAESGQQAMAGIYLDSVAGARVEGGFIRNVCGDGVLFSGERNWGSMRGAPSEDGLVDGLVVDRCGRNGVCVVQGRDVTARSVKVSRFGFNAFNFEPDGQYSDHGSITIQDYRASDGGLHLPGGVETYHPGIYGINFAVGSYITDEAKAKKQYPHFYASDVFVDGVPPKQVPTVSANPDLNGQATPNYGYGMMVTGALNGATLRGIRVRGAIGGGLLLRSGRGINVTSLTVETDPDEPYFFLSDPDPGTPGSTLNTVGLPTVGLVVNEQDLTGASGQWKQRLVSARISGYTFRGTRVAGPSQQRAEAVWLRDCLGTVEIEGMQCVFETRTDNVGVRATNARLILRDSAIVQVAGNAGGTGVRVEANAEAVPSSLQTAYSIITDVRVETMATGVHITKAAGDAGATGTVLHRLGTKDVTTPILDTSGLATAGTTGTYTY